MKSLESLTVDNSLQLAALEGRLCYSFRQQELLQLALVHRSFAFEQGDRLNKDNERLEFLGDAVLDLAIGSALFSRFPEMPEGEMTRLRAMLVKESYLAGMAARLDLGSCLCLGRGEDASDGRGKPSILASSFEAVLGAIFHDGGYEAACVFVEHHFGPGFDNEKEKLHLADAKSRLQELLQEKYNEAPLYSLEKEEGPDHQKIFSVSVRFRDQVLAQGRARSKKEAEQNAAAAALEKLEELGLE